MQTQLARAPVSRFAAMNMHKTISPAIDAHRIERARAFVRAQDFVPRTVAEVDAYRVGLRSGAHSNAIEGNPFDANDWAFFDMLIEERATDAVCIAALHFDIEQGRTAQLAA